MRSLIWIFWLFSLGQLVAQPGKLKGNTWFCSLQMEEETIHFALEQQPTHSIPPQFWLWNGKERIELSHNRIEGDTIICPISIYDAELRFPAHMGEAFAGRYLKNDTKYAGYFLLFNANKNSSNSAQVHKTWHPLLKGNWIIEFLENGLVTDTGFGVFQYQGDSIYGSILSETGDYRYLNGVQTSIQQAYVQSFNGAQTYKFVFKKIGNEWKGTFYVNKFRQMEFRARPTDKNPLTDGFSRSQGRPGSRFQFVARGPQGENINENDPRWKGKALVVQVLGSWCPNCLDETRFLNEYFQKKPENVSFIGLAFERKSDPEYVWGRINNLKNRLQPAYPIWWGGFAHKDSAAKVLPSLTGIAAFPSTIFVKANGDIVKVHTGFSGPATGEYYLAWKREFEQLLEEISKP